MINLKGITWNHSRGLLPMVATAQRFSELYPNVNITWEKRSLQQFGLSVGVSPTEIIKKTWSVETPTIKEIKRKYSGEDD
jgi:hypothetical protein